MQAATGHGFGRKLTVIEFARLCRLACDKPTEWPTQLPDCVDTLDAGGMPSGTDTMFSTVGCQDLYIRRWPPLTISYPKNAEPVAGFVSVLSPVDCALPGLRVGDVGRCQTPSGEGGSTQVMSVPFQPEASGDYTL